MTSVSVRFEKMTASHRFELQSETKDDHQQSRKLRQNIPKIHRGGSSSVRIKTPSTSSSCTNNTFVTS